MDVDRSEDKGPALMHDGATQGAISRKGDILTLRPARRMDIADTKSLGST